MYLQPQFLSPTATLIASPPVTPVISPPVETIVPSPLLTDVLPSVIPTPTPTVLPSFSVTISPQTLELGEGMNGTIRCQITHPDGSFVWMRDFGSLPSNVRITKPNSYTSELTIYNMTQQNTGNYQCRATSSNTMESSTVFTTLIFIGVCCSLLKELCVVIKFLPCIFWKQLVVNWVFCVSRNVRIEWWSKLKLYQHFSCQCQLQKQM